MTAGANVIRTPTEAERLALFDVLSHSILRVRNNAAAMTSEQISCLMDAVHNIPYYLQSHEEHYWETVLWDLTRFDGESAEKLYSPGLMEIFNDSKSRYAETRENL